MENKNILIGVSGGIAAYKACALVSKLVQKKANVKVIMTKSATEFVTPLTFQALSGNFVYTDTFIEPDPHKIAHIDLADWADLIILAPATANVIGNLANGLANDMLTTTILAARADIYIAPAMNVHMYANQAVMANIEKLHKWGYHFIEPGAGYLACGHIGNGRLEEPEKIIEAIEAHSKPEQLLAGKKVLISAGPTREQVDPVRFFTNKSTGKMGFALAEAAATLGADVTLVAGPVALRTKHTYINRIDVVTAAEMDDAIQAYYPNADIVIQAAAVADYRPKVVYTEKMKKLPGDLQIEMERTKDILLALGEQKTTQFLVGFAAETNDPIENGLGKLARKHLDAIIINDVSVPGAGFASDTNIVTYINKQGDQHHIPLASKADIADKLLLAIIADLNGAQD